MPTIQDTTRALEQWFAQIERLETEKRTLHRTAFADQEALDTGWIQKEREIRLCREGVRRALELQERWPERFERHSQRMADLHRDGDFERSVFIMTKYPGEDQSPQATQLRRVIRSVVDAVKACGYRARLASDQNHHRWLWDNVELYLCGCARGIAIVEDRYVPELNPNVAMEWGWMVGMGRGVLFLREERFEHDRADWAGLMSEPFSWDEPEPGVAQAIKRFLLKESGVRGNP